MQLSYSSAHMLGEKQHVRPKRLCMLLSCVTAERRESDGSIGGKIYQ